MNIVLSSTKIDVNVADNGTFISTPNSRDLIDLSKVIMPSKDSKHINWSALDKKAKGAVISLIQFKDGDFKTVVDIRVYEPAAFKTGMERVAAVVWFQGGDSEHFVVHGSAGGCGYDKVSAAISDAFGNAGFDPGFYSHGAGINTIYDALAVYAAKKELHNWAVIAG